MMIGYGGTGTFTQTGGLNTDYGSDSAYIGLGYLSGSSGTYSLGGNGQLLVTNSGQYGYSSFEYVGYSGSGTFTQSGGTNTVSCAYNTGALYLGYSPGSSGVYNLSGSGHLSAGYEFVGWNPGTTGLFQQSGGSNVVASLSIGSGGLYQLSGGTLQVNGNLQDLGVFEGGGSAGVLTVGGSSFVDFSAGVLQNAGAIAVNAGPNTLLIVPPGFNTSTGFRSYQSLGLTHTAGTTLTVPAGSGFVGSASINDPVACQGTLAAPSGGSINLDNGLTLSGTGYVGLGPGALTNNDPTSGISGGTLSATNQYVGSGGTGTFSQSGGYNTPFNLFLGFNTNDVGGYVQSGGTNSVGQYLYVGYNSGSSGTYTQTGGTNGVAQGLYLGYNSGSSGTYTQTGGTNSIASWLFLGYNAGSTGTYNLSGSGQLSAPSREQIGNSGTGNFQQSGGTNSTGWLGLGYNAGSNGIYGLSGGLMSSYQEVVGDSGSGTFQQSGGTNTPGELRTRLQCRQQRHVWPQCRHVVVKSGTRWIFRERDLRTIGRRQYDTVPCNRQ